MPYFATAMDVAVTETFGQVKVTDPAAANKSLGKAYVKVYANLRTAA